MGDRFCVVPFPKKNIDETTGMIPLQRIMPVFCIMQMLCCEYIDQAIQKEKDSYYGENVTKNKRYHKTELSLAIPDKTWYTENNLRKGAS